jgi:hypothetical protein
MKKITLIIFTLLFVGSAFAQLATSATPDPHSLDAEQQPMDSRIDIEGVPPLGTLLQRHFPLNVREYYRHYPSGFALAEGGCLEDAKFPNGVKLLGAGGAWPYGRCDDTHFKLPMLSCRDSADQTCHVLIKVGP